MGRRAVIIFWSATAAAVFLAGGVVATVPGALRGATADVVLLAVSSLGLLASLLVAGRIVVVAGRLQRQRRWLAATGRSGTDGSVVITASRGPAGPSGAGGPPAR